MRVVSCGFEDYPCSSQNLAGSHYWVLRTAIT